MNVDFPAPFGPVRPKRLPGPKEQVTSSNSLWPPKLLLTLSTTIIGHFQGGGGVYPGGRIWESGHLGESCRAYGRGWPPPRGSMSVVRRNGAAVRHTPAS